MVRQFNEGLVDPARGFDAVLVHFPITTSVQPARVFVSEVGPTLRLYSGRACRFEENPIAATEFGDDKSGPRGVLGFQAWR